MEILTLYLLILSTICVIFYKIGNKNTGRHVEDLREDTHSKKNKNTHES